MNNENDHYKVEGISILTATNKVDCMENIFANYERQEWTKKELIIILNNDLMDLEKWKLEAEKYKSVSVYKLSENRTLGECLNLGVKNAKYKYVAKFDDDDYYGPNYLEESIDTMLKQNAAVVGKRTCFMYLPDHKELKLRFPGHEMCRVTILQGGTIFTTKKLLQLIPFPNKNLGECYSFIQRCRRKKYKICSSSRYNYAYFRKEDEHHTWHPTENYLNETSELVGYTEQFEHHVNSY